MIASCKRLPNLGEILSPTVQGPVDRADIAPTSTSAPTPTQGEEERTNGTYHCDLYSVTGRCDVCHHMVERSYVQSEFYGGRKFAIHGRNIHTKATDRNPLRWFVYLEEDLPCKLQYVGSTNSMTARWANTKLRCNQRDSDSTGLYKHFRDGCPNDIGIKKETIRISLIDFMETSVEKLRVAKYKSGNCKCVECDKLRRIENKWILSLGTFYGRSGLNARNVIES